MANTIKLKRGSGSDPSASDLAVGELAIRTDLGKIFTKKERKIGEVSKKGWQKWYAKRAILLIEAVWDTFPIVEFLVNIVNECCNNYSVYRIVSRVSCVRTSASQADTHG